MDDQVLNNAVVRFRIELAKIVSPYLDLEKFIDKTLELEKRTIEADSDEVHFANDIYYNTMPLVLDPDGKFGTSLKQSQRFSAYYNQCLELVRAVKQYLFGDQLTAARSANIVVDLGNSYQLRNGKLVVLLDNELRDLSRSAASEIELLTDESYDIAVKEGVGFEITAPTLTADILGEIKNMIQETYASIVSERIPDINFADEFLLALETNEIGNGLYTSLIQDVNNQLTGYKGMEEDFIDSYKVNLNDPTFKMNYRDAVIRLLGNFDDNDMAQFLSTLEDLITEDVLYRRVA